MTRRGIPAVVLAACLALAAAPAGAACGDGLLETGETCAACAADCSPAPCQGGAGTQTVALSVTAPGAQTLVAVTLQLAYRRGVLRLPADAAAQRQRVRAGSEGGLVAPKDLGYAVRVVAARAGGLPPGRPVAEVELDRCAGAKPAGAADLSCTVLGCAGTGGQLGDCTCSLAIR